MDTNRHSHYIAQIPTWCANNPIGRAYARRKLTRLATAALAERGFTLTGRVCVHFSTLDGKSLALSHFVVQDDLAVAYEQTETGR